MSDGFSSWGRCSASASRSPCSISSAVGSVSATALAWSPTWRGSMLALRRDSWGFVDATQREMLLAYPEAQLDRAAYIAAAEVLEGSSRHMSLVYRWAAAHNRLAAGEALGKERMPG